jgi:cytochrome c5
MPKKIIALLIILVMAGLLAQAAVAQRPEPTEDRMPMMSDRLAPPPTVYPPTQADQGAQLYYQICMVCHGDRGQGLTEEWRNELDPEDRNCWQSRCHATNHPPDGFIFPQTVPPVVGPAMIARFTTALDLFQFLQTRMPWQAAGSRSEQEYWQLTAYLLRLSGVDPGAEPLTAGRAAGLWLNPTLQPTPTPLPVAQLLPARPVDPSQLWLGLAAGGGLVAILAFLLVKYMINRDQNR